MVHRCVQVCTRVHRGVQVVHRGVQVVHRGVQVVHRGVHVVHRGVQVVHRGVHVVHRGVQECTHLPAKVDHQSSDQTLHTQQVISGEIGTHVHVYAITYTQAGSLALFTS